MFLFRLLREQKNAQYQPTLKIFKHTGVEMENTLQQEHEERMVCKRVTKENAIKELVFCF